MARKSVPVTFIGESSPTSDAPIVADNSNDPVINDTGNADPELINGFDTFNPADGEPDTGGSGDSGGGTGKRRGRKPGSINKNGPKASKVNLGGLEQILLSLHMMAGGFFDAPELALAPEEAKAMAESAATVAALYHHTLDPRTMAWIHLAMVCGGVYGTRVMAIRARIKAEEKAIPKQNVFPIAGTESTKTRSSGSPIAPRTPADFYSPGDYSFAPNVGE